MIHYGKHHVDEEDIAAVVEVLRNGTLTQGLNVDHFEEAFSEYVGAKFAVAVSSGTAALHLACIAAGIKQGGNVVTSANTFVSSANCAVFVGANPVFCDIDPTTLNISSEDLRERCAKLGSVDAIIPVHLGGLACEMDAIREVAKDYDAVLIEDAAHALGGTYSCNAKIGSCKYSEMTIFSFHPVKAIAAGEGGMITTNSRSLYERLIKLRSHGIFHQKLLSVFDNADPKTVFKNGEEAFEDGKVNPWYFEMQELGYNYRLTEIQCALAKSQLSKLDKFISRRRKLALRYDKEFNNQTYLTPAQLNGHENSARHLYITRIDFQSLGMSRSRFMRALMAEGVGTQVHYIPVPLHPYYKSQGIHLSDYPETENYYRSALSIPIYYGLKDEQQSQVIQSILSLVS